jgi:hypothetical protein
MERKPLFYGNVAGVYAQISGKRKLCKSCISQAFIASMVLIVNLRSQLGSFHAYLPGGYR